MMQKINYRGEWVICVQPRYANNGYHILLKQPERCLIFHKLKDIAEFDVYKYPLFVFRERELASEDIFSEVLEETRRHIDQYLKEKEQKESLENLLRGEVVLTSCPDCVHYNGVGRTCKKGKIAHEYTYCSNMSITEI